MAKIKKIKSDSTVSMIETPTAADRVVDVIVVLLCALVAFCSVIPMWHVLMSSISDGKLLLVEEKKNQKSMQGEPARVFSAF